MPIAGLAVTTAGWFISSAQANSREARKEKRTEVDACCKLAADILGKARTYYLKAPSDESTESEGAELSFSVMRLLKRLERLESQKSKFKVKGAGAELFEAVTGEDFQSAARKPKGPLDPQIRRIEQAVHRVIDDLESGFEDVFKGWWERIVEWRKAQRRGDQ